MGAVRNNAEEATFQDLSCKFTNLRKYFPSSKCMDYLFFWKMGSGFKMKSIQIICYFLFLEILCVTKFSYCKVHIFWEGHKILQNLHLTFVLCSASPKKGGDFTKFFGLLRIYVLHRGDFCYKLGINQKVHEMQ